MECRTQSFAFDSAGRGLELTKRIERSRFAAKIVIKLTDLWA